jgi:UDP:flavonoid glycosyltransferase YjiC (YdhE family)
VFPRFYAAVLETLADLSVRVLMTLGEDADPGALGPIPPNAHVERWWPQDDVMPHTELVISHGGFGTTLSALGAGVVQVVVPLFAFDQFENSRRIAEVGIGVAVPARSNLRDAAAAMTVATPGLLDELRRATAAALGEEEMRRRAREIALEIGRLPTCETCASTLERPHDRG